MFKNKKLSFVIAVAVAVVSASAMGIVFTMSDISASKILIENAESNMKASIDNKAHIIDEYISNDVFARKLTFLPDVLFSADIPLS